MNRRQYLFTVKGVERLQSKAQKSENRELQVEGVQTCDLWKSRDRQITDCCSVAA